MTVASVPAACRAYHDHHRGQEHDKRARTCTQVVAEAQKAVEWLREKLAAQAACAKTDDALLTAADIWKREDTVVRFCEPIMSRQPPPLPKVCAAAGDPALGSAVKSNAS
jgi:hypothetical protein